MESRYQQIPRIPCKTRFYTPVSARSRQTFVFTARNQNSLDPGQKVARFNNGGEEGGEGRGFEKSGKTSGGSIGSVSAATNQPPPWKHGRIEEEIETRKGCKRGKSDEDRYIYIYIKKKEKWIDCQRRSDLGRWSCP